MFEKQRLIGATRIKSALSALILSILWCPPTSAFSASLQFVPPPMEGTISMGIYDGTGKLVRSLHRADSVESDVFGKALNGLITSWDGKNDAGTSMPAGKYFARGYGVGDLAVEGEAMLGNDFIVADDSPRVKRILDIQSAADGKIDLTTQTALDSFLILTCDKTGTVISQAPTTSNPNKDLNETASVRDGKVFLQSNPLKLPASIHPSQACLAGEGGVWLIDHPDDGTTDIKQFSPTGELIRRLAVQPNDPVPLKVSVSGSDLILFEGNQTTQRVRELSPMTSGSAAASGTEQAISTWKVLFSKTITFSDTLDAARGLLKFPSGKPFLSQDPLKVALLPNPLMQDQPSSLDISVGIDAEGSFLKTKDGLLLQRISSTPHLKWATLGREPGSKVVVLFQSDGTVVEEYHISHPANMMAFDCGDFDFNPAKP